jgi:pre-mRNA-splicing factor SPF27
MHRMKKGPKDYLAEMPPAHELTFKGCPLLKKEFERVASGGGAMPPPDSTRYELAPPPKSKRGDENAWEVAVANARSQLEHQGLRIQNLELAQKFAPNAWRAHNASLEAAIMT